MSAPYELFASCAPGLEPLLEAELRPLGALKPEVTPGGVTFRGHRRVVYRANLESGLATHVLLRVASFSAQRFDILERELAAVPWERFLRPGVQRTFRVSAKKSRLLHTGAIEERAETAIAKRLGEVAPEADDADAVPITLRLVNDRVQVSIDTSGSALHRRGYRTHGGPAPLREDLARALVIASGWDRRSPLLDPLCGTGTIPIEAALLASQRPVGAARSFAFEQTPLLDPATWRSVKETADQARRGSPPITGRDRDPKAIEASRHNAALAGVEVTLEQAPLSSPFETDAPDGAVVTHPPFGHRMSASRDLTPLYHALGRVVPAGWRLGLMAADRRLGLKASPDLRTMFLTDAGGIKVRALCTPQQEHS